MNWRQNKRHEGCFHQAKVLPVESASSDLSGPDRLWSGLPLIDVIKVVMVQLLTL